ncbi:hypothetical protein A8W25_06130 [Streptomyces sp. ERV7]|nr:hypothetical protein A8W25_06130 [Streptomyces sp. ERV7]
MAFSAAGSTFRLIRYVRRVASIEATPATMGAATAGSSTLVTTVEPFTEDQPADITAAPIRPPNRAWDELDGRPSSQVTRFQRMAPTSAAKMTSVLMPFSLMIPPEIVLATSTDRNAPTRFSAADMATAALGFRAPVEMVVAIALAVSWKPFVKSNTRAVTTTMASSSVMCSIYPGNRSTSVAGRT